MRRLKLNQTLLIAVTLSLVPVLLLSVIQGIWSRDYARELIQERLVSSTLATASLQAEPFLMVRRMITTYANDPDVVGATDKCSEMLRRGFRVQRGALNFARIARDGSLKCSALPFSGPISNANEPWFRHGEAKGGFTISNPVMGKIVKRRLLVAMQALQDRNGQFDGAITAAIDVSWMEKALERRKLSKDAIVAIVDETGKPLLSSGRDGLPPVDLAASMGAQATMRAPDGSVWAYSSAPLFERQLFIVYAELQKPLFSTSTDQLRLSLLPPLLALILTCVVVWAVMNRYVLRWLRSISTMAQQFARGDYRLQPDRFDNAPSEFAALGDDLQNMALAIEDRDTALRALIERNRAMAREVNHRVKNNLQMVMSLLSLQGGRVRDPEARKALDQTRIRMGAIALIHRLLYDFDDGSEAGSVDMKMLVPELCAQLRKSFPASETELSCHANMGVMPVDQAIPLTLFVVEAVTNAFRHAFPSARRGAISVTFDGDTSQGSVTVHDTGIGQTVTPLDDAMGLDLMNAYATQLYADLEIDAVADRGVVVSLRYPRQKPA
jgi:two-component sensor histidine kinase